MKPGSVNIFTTESANDMEYTNTSETPRSHEDFDAEDEPLEENQSPQEEIPATDERAEAMQENCAELTDELEDNKTDGAREIATSDEQAPQGIASEGENNYEKEKMASL